MKTRKTSARVTIVGAGPGDPELITLKGRKALCQADVVLYDALVNLELLEFAPPSAKKIFVGKRTGKHSVSQEEIHIKLVTLALAHGHVVRLKGGDPFVFGPGQEELDYVKRFGIDAEVIPGISSSISLPELQGVPLTQKHVNESFWVLTGATPSGQLSKDVAIAAQSSATSVILMGMKKLPEIVAAFQQEGRGHTPVLIIQNGSLPEEQIGLGTISNIEAEVSRKGLGAPAVIVIGEVVRLHPDYAFSLADSVHTSSPIP